MQKKNGNPSKRFGLKFHEMEYTHENIFFSMWWNTCGFIGKTFMEIELCNCQNTLQK